MILHNVWADVAIFAAAAGILAALILWYVAVIRPDRQRRRDTAESGDPLEAFAGYPPVTRPDRQRPVITAGDTMPAPAAPGPTPGRHRAQGREGEVRPIVHGR